MPDPLVLLPGMMCDARLFAPQMADLSRDHAVMVAPISQGERVEEIASDLLGLLPAKFALAGLSMGGIVAMELLRRAPERITRLALMDTNPLAETPQSAAAYEPMIIGARAGRLDEVLRFEGAPGPNGLLFDESRGRLLVAHFASGAIVEWTPGAATVDTIATGPGSHDGVVRLADRRILVSSWADSTVHVLENGSLTPLLGGLPSPADLGLDERTGTVAVPLFELGRVEFWRVSAP
jgi:pimeloyl-ACP methyl ester carboxylesterase